MPKVKSHRGAAKRVRPTASGKFKRGKAFKSKLLTNKTAKRKRNLRNGGLISEVDQKSVERMLPYS